MMWPLYDGRPRALAQLAFIALAWAAASAFGLACGSRTGLLVPDNLDGSMTGLADGEAGGPDATLDARDAGEEDGSVSLDAPPLFEGGLLDAPMCETPPYCNATDPGRIYRCGEPYVLCSSLEQCRQVAEGPAECVNPCLDTLGQNTSNGCEFYVAELDTPPQAAGVCYAAYVVNQWASGEPARIEVSRGGTVLPIEQFARIPVGQGNSIAYAPYNANRGLAKDEIAILFLSRDPNAASTPGRPDDPKVLADCPPGVTPAVVGDAALHGTGIFSAFRIRTNVPVVGYDMLPYGGGRARVTSATLLLPTNVWQSNYVLTSAYHAPPPNMTDGQMADPTFMIFAQQDDTQVRIRPVKAIDGGRTVLGSPANVPATYSLNRGQYLQITQPADLSGSAVESTKPVGVIGGNQLIDVSLLPIGQYRADTAHQMLPPVRTLGSEYVGVRYRARANRPNEIVPWRIVGAADGTLLSFDPPQPGAPSGVNAGTVTEFPSPGPFVVSSQDADHPFYLAQYMTGGGWTGPGPMDDGLNGEGDPEFVNVVSPPQYLPRYTFFTDPTYPETNLVMTRARNPASGTFPEVALDCAGVLQGWTPVGSSGRYEYTRIDLSTGDFQGQNGCNNGVHVIESVVGAGAAQMFDPSGHFGITVWGWGNPITDPVRNDSRNPAYSRWVSYAYPGGANFSLLNSVVVPTMP
jgi:hypothetical protein